MCNFCAILLDFAGRSRRFETRHAVDAVHMPYRHQGYDLCSVPMVTSSPSFGVMSLIRPASADIKIRLRKSDRTPRYSDGFNRGYCVLSGGFYAVCANR